MAIGEIEIDELADLVAEGARIIDVREPDEYANGHVPGAELIPLGTVADHLDRFAGRRPDVRRSAGPAAAACAPPSWRRPKDSTS